MPFISANAHDVTQFGAVGDGCSMDTLYIQQALDTCSRAGGGTVYVPPGNYRTGTLRIHSHTRLYLDHGAVLVGSSELADYEREGVRFGMILARGCESITLEGGGVLDGNGDSFMDFTKKVRVKGNDFDPALTRQGEQFGLIDGEDPDGAVCHGERPFQMLIFTECRNITIKDITIRNAPCWTLHFHDSENLNVSGIRILNNLLVPNNDGIDITCCRNVRVSDCHIEAGDDAIAITGFNLHEGFPGFFGTENPCENISVTNCILQSRSAGIRVGAGTNDIRKVVVSNVIVRDSNRGFIIWVRDGNRIEDIMCSNLHIETRFHTGCWWGKAEPVAISCLRRHENTPLGTVRNVRFNSVHARSSSGVVLFSEEESAIQNVTFHQFQLELMDDPNAAAVGGNFDFRPTYRKEIAVFAHAVHGIFAHKISGLVIDGFRCIWENLLHGQARTVLLEDCDGARIRDLQDHKHRETAGLGSLSKEEVQSGSPIVHHDFTLER